MQSDYHPDRIKRHNDGKQAGGVWGGGRCRGAASGGGGDVAAVRRERSRSVIASSLFGGSGATTHVFPLWAFQSHFRYFKIRAHVFVYPAGETFLLPEGGPGLVWKRRSDAAKMWRARSRETLAAASGGLLVWATRRRLKQKFLLLHQIKCPKKTFCHYRLSGLNI